MLQMPSLVPVDQKIQGAKYLYFSVFEHLFKEIYHWFIC